MKFDPNDFRLFIKGLVTLWVPVALALGFINWDAQVATLVMAASTGTIDGFFRVFGVKEEPLPPE